MMHDDDNEAEQFLDELDGRPGEVAAWEMVLAACARPRDREAAIRGVADLMVQHRPDLDMVTGVLAHEMAAVLGFDEGVAAERLAGARERLAFASLALRAMPPTDE